MGAHTPMQGSVFWMAPEVVDSREGYNSKVDIWSVGCVVFGMWTGERPWNGQDAVAVLLQVCLLQPTVGVVSTEPLFSSTNRSSALRCQRALFCLLRETIFVIAVSLRILTNGQLLESCGSIRTLYSRPVGCSLASHESSVI